MFDKTYFEIYYSDYKVGRCIISRGGDWTRFRRDVGNRGKKKEEVVVVVLGVTG